MRTSRSIARLVRRATMAAGLAGLAPPWARAQQAQELPQECRTLWGALATTTEAGDLKAAVAAEREIGTDPVCNAYLSVAAKEAVLGLYRREDARLERTGAAPQERIAQLTAALRYGNAWNAWDIHARIGELRRKLPGADGAPDYAAISLAYDNAVRSIDLAPAPARPAPAEIERVVRLAYQYEALSPTPVARRAALSETARQVNVEWVPAPLQFVYDSDAMTEAGQAQAESLLRQLQALDMPAVHLVGHTDPVGSDGHNDKLSVRRALAIKGFLAARGYPAGRITTEGRGKRDIGTLKIAERASFTEAQIHQMLRRVELHLEE